MENPYLAIVLLMELILWWAAPKLPIKWINPAGWCALAIGGLAVCYLGFDAAVHQEHSLKLVLATVLQCYVVGTAAWLAWKNSKPF